MQKPGSDSAAVAPTPTPPCQGRAVGFLDLSGELRNYIYEYAAEESTLVKLSHEPSLTKNNIDYIAQERTLLGLTRTCKQVRDEFLPIYLGTTTIAFPYYQVDQYISTFVDPQRGTFDDAVGSIILLRPRVLATRLPVNILPLVKIIARAPRLVARFLNEDTDDFRQNSLFNSLLNTHHDPRWDVYAASSLSQITISSRTNEGLKATTVVKKECAESWMGLNFYRTPKCLDAAMAWSKRVGLNRNSSKYTSSLYHFGQIVPEDSATPAKLDSE
ncbi:hypothetical protein J4E93_005945 [Alternaria ventricosa]|uniref:uncharacterized protein n=1 Tax=Alternaria ventricosa TaxID=1187951 RepID=UPI0020C4B143|nr:uncharacterized protein J4E93_005945 [Alternaria ventricosa]KAI4645145.1 hypothetical protein J4E93_005945 [Alternaria ventricosa]